VGELVADLLDQRDGLAVVLAGEADDDPLRAESGVAAAELAQHLRDVAGLEHRDDLPLLGGEQRLGRGLGGVRRVERGVHQPAGRAPPGQRREPDHDRRQRDQPVRLAQDRQRVAEVLEHELVQQRALAGAAVAGRIDQARRHRGGDVARQLHHGQHRDGQPRDPKLFRPAVHPPHARP
jgi:hypothetical protein